MKKNERVSNWEEREKVDRNRDGIDDRIEAPIPDVSAGQREQEERLRQNTHTDPGLSAGDIDAKWEMGEWNGEETVSGDHPTPDQSNTEDVAGAVGIHYQDDEELKVGEKERARDKDRWELDPASSEDYAERAREQKKK